MNGVKLDAGKTRWSLIPWDVMHLLAKVLTYGSIKYEDNNWMKVVNAKIRYKDAMLRHFYAYETGEWLDPESNLPHIGHALCCMVFIVWFELMDRAGNKKA